MYKNYKKNTHIHFVGIGGIGMSGIATILRLQGYEISGCDVDLEQTSVQNLLAIGCTIHQGNNTPACFEKPIDILVYSSAVKANAPEIITAQEKGIPTIPRALMLAELMRTKHSIAIAGAHGKTTTTSLISHILIEANMDPTVIIGGHLQTISNNARFGGGNFLVAEADESDRSLAKLHATLGVITNIDLEHLETYTDIEDIKGVFRQFLNNIPFYGKAIVCIDDANVRSMLPIPHLKTIQYGTSTNADLYASDIVLEGDHSTFTVWDNCAKECLGSVYLAIPGRHNVLNSLAAIAIARDVEVPFNVIAEALKTFKGVDRRFTFKGTCNGAELFDDYGHHPREVASTLAVARKRSKGRLIVVFQPHRYTRTHKLWDEFVDCFKHESIDKLILTDIYPASEAPIANITGQNLVKAIQQAGPTFSVDFEPYEANFASLAKALEKECQPGDLVLFLGAGKLNKLAEKLAAKNK
jgi:UDP-N-acetylmuramate--alanine ligase